MPTSSFTGLAVALATSCLFTTASGTEQQHYHPGHAPFHVTRLHRWDHSGMSSMLEEEAHWQSLVSDSDMAAEVFHHGAARHSLAARSRQQSPAPRRSLRAGALGPELVSSSRSTARPKKHHRKWLRISPVQASALMEHQKAFSSSHLQHQQKRMKSTMNSSVRRAATESYASSEMNSSSDFARAQSSAQVEYTVEDDDSSPKSGRSQGAHRRFHKKSSPYRQGMAVTGLTSLSSQYVGPIGVGTVVAPETCSLHDGQALQFLGPEAELTRQLGCHLEDESKVWVVFDTGSTNIWVSSDLCQFGPCTKRGRHRYNHTRSATYDWPRGGLELTVQFGTGCIKGPQAKDDFHIGPFTVFNQTFGMIETQNGSVFTEVPFEGILGLAFKSMSANGVSPFFDNIIQQKALVHNEFAFYFSVDSVTANAVFWGGVDPSFFEGQIEFFPVIDPYYWTLELLSFKIGDKPFYPKGLTAGKSSSKKSQQKSLEEDELDLETDNENDALGGSDEEYDEDQNKNDPGTTRQLRPDGSKPWSAIVDTGTTFFTAEGEMFDEIMELLPPAQCDKMTETSHPPLTYRLKSSSGHAIDFVLHNHQYMTSGSSDADAECSPAFMRIDIPPEHGPALVLGECFLRHYYAVFDRADGHPRHARVGFAKSRHDKQPVDQLMRLTKGQQYFQLPEADGL